MEGINILNSFEVIVEYAFNWKSFWIGFILGFLLVWAVIFIAWKGDLHEIKKDLKPILKFGLIVGIIVALFIGLIGGHVTEIPIDYETHYEVSINENVSMQEFMEKYEILETRGNILVVKERN